MHIYKYGIVVHQLLTGGTSKWKVALLDGFVHSHVCIDVPTELFDFEPASGTSVKAKFMNEMSVQPSAVTKCGDYEWIRDVEVVNSKAVIFVIVRLSAECVETSACKENADVQYCIIENEDTDFRRIAVPKTVLEQILRRRSPFQRPEEPLIYRVGVFWNPLTLEGCQDANWQYYPDFPIVPIFELYFRDTTLPYLSDSMTYGVLEGIVIAKNDFGALYWTVMGCAVLSNFTRETSLPPLGSVNLVLIKRCLAEKSFGFSCCYELLPETKSHSWPELKIIPDDKNGCAYIETCCKCVRMNEDGAAPVAMLVPHIGKVYRGLQRYWEKLSVGRDYHFRIEFQKESDSFVPVIVDLCLNEDVLVKCRVAYVSQETKTYYAVLEPHGEAFVRMKKRIDFVVIPFRVLYCAQRLVVEKEELMQKCYSVRIRLPRKEHDVVDAVHVLGVTHSPKDPAYSILNRTVWIRAMVIIRNFAEQHIDLIHPQLEQVITDVSRLAAGKPVGSSIAVQAQFAITPENVPVFWVRNIASTVHLLPRISQQSVSNHQALPEAFSSVFVSDPASSHSEYAPTSSAISRSRSTGYSDSGTNPDESDSFIASNNQEVSSILNESEFERRQNPPQDSFHSTDDLVVTESFLASSAPSTIIVVQHQESHASSDSDNSTDTGYIVTESVMGSSVCSMDFDHPKNSAGIDVARMTIQRPNLPSPTQRRFFGYNTNTRRGTRVHGFGPSNYSNYRRPMSPGNGRRRRMVKYGFRRLRESSSHACVLDDMVYRFIENRKMFVDNEIDAKESWFHAPYSKVTKTKKNLSFVIPVERVSYQREFQHKHKRFSDLVRFVVVDKMMNACDASVVIPVGGTFPDMPKDFQLGNRYKVEHYSFFGDRMCRFGGFAVALNNFMFHSESPMDVIKNIQLKENSRGHEYLRFKIDVTRPCTPEVVSDVFEFWTCEQLPGHVIVEKTAKLMETLEPLNSTEDEQHVYSAVIEPLAGGPMDASILRADSDDDDVRLDIIVFWRLVVEFSDTVPNVPKPIFVSRMKKPIRPTTPVKREVGSIAVKDYGMWKTMHINSVLAQERMDRLRALNDPRIRMLDGPPLKPEIEKRKVDVDSRRISMFKAMKAFADQLPALQRKGQFHSVFIEDFIAEIERLEPYDDNHHPHQTKKRTYSLEAGLNYLTNILLKGYRTMNENEEDAKLLIILAECLGLNTTYLKKTEEVQKMLLFFRKNKLHSYI